MNQRRRIFFYIFGLYHLFILSFVIYVESQKEDLSVLYGLYSKISLLKYGAVLGIVLFAVDFAWNWFESRNSRKEHDTLRHENNTLKAKVYDFQEAAKPPVKETTASGTK